MKIHWLKIITAGALAGIGAIVILVALVAAPGPREAEAAQAFANRLGRWVGPIGGAAMCFLGALWSRRGLARGHALQRMLLGAVAAICDVPLLVLSGAPLELHFIISNTGRLLAGTPGGLPRARRNPA